MRIRRILSATAVGLLATAGLFVGVSSAQAVGTSTLTPNTFQTGAGNTAFTFDVTGLSTSSTMTIEFTLGSATSDLNYPTSCTTTASSTLADCGVTGFTVNGSAMSATVKRNGATAGTSPHKAITLTFASTSVTSYQIAFAADSFTMSTGPGSYGTAASSNVGGTGGGAATAGVLLISKVFFNANGGSGSMNFMTYAANVAQNIPANTFTNGSATFTGWNTAANGSGTSYSDAASLPFDANARTLYAQWTAASGGGSSSGGSSTDSGLASTGANPAGPLGLAALLTLAGAVVIVTRRRAVQR